MKYITQILISAAHCFCDENRATWHLARDLKIYIHIGFRSMIEYCDGTEHSQQIQIMKPEMDVNIFTQPIQLFNFSEFSSWDKKWEEFDRWYKNKKRRDIAILRCPLEINYQKTYSKPVTLLAYVNQDWYSRNVQSTAVGWGNTIKNNLTNKESVNDLKSYNLVTEACSVSNYRCLEPELRQFADVLNIDKDVFCGVGLGEETNRQIVAHGDSGGAIFYRNNAELLQIGINVFTYNDCYAGFVRIDIERELI